MRSATPRKSQSRLPENGRYNAPLGARRRRSLRHSRQMTILCSPKVTHHHADAVALLALGKRGSCPRANPCEPWPAALLRLRSEEHTSELQSRLHLVCRLLLEKKKRTE